MESSIYKIQGVVQNYAWGGYSFIPRLLNFQNIDNKPYAEYWLGAHPSASSSLLTADGPLSWYNEILKNPQKHLGKKVFERFNGLPFLLKVLDVREMLSIQVHPTKKGAEEGFDEEEKRGIPINAPHRNYKDRNHKPEMMIALSEFWLLHGFKREKELQETLETIPEFFTLKDIFLESGYKGLYKSVMEMDQAETDMLLMPLVKRVMSLTFQKNEPGYWVNKLFKGGIPHEGLDKGIFSIYFFNVVQLQKGQGIFQGAGVPHAYLEGQNIELMANSDNVLRGGLTPKYVDVPELLKHINFEGIDPVILHGMAAGNVEKNFEKFVEDFGMSVLEIKNGREYLGETNSAEIFLIMEGEVVCGGISYKKGEALAIFAETSFTIHVVHDAILYRAFIPFSA